MTCAVGIGSAVGGPGPEAAGSHEREDGPATGIFEFIPERAAGKYDFVRGKRHGMAHVLQVGRYYIS